MIPSRAAWLSWFSNHHLYRSIRRSVRVTPPDAERTANSPISLEERKALPSTVAVLPEAACHMSSTYAPLQWVRIPGNPRSSPAVYSGLAPRRRARSHAEVATDPPAPSFPFSHASLPASHRAGKGSCRGKTARRAPEHARVGGRLGHQTPPSARGPVQVPRGPVLGVHHDREVRLHAGLRQDAKGVFTDTTSALSRSSRRRGSSASSDGPPATRQAGHAAEETFQGADPRAIEEGPHVAAQVSHPEPTEPVQRVDVDVAPQDPRLHHLFRGPVRGGIPFHHRPQPQEARPGQRQGLQQAGEPLRLGPDMEEDAGIGKEPGEVPAGHGGPEKRGIRLHHEERRQREAAGGPPRRRTPGRSPWTITAVASRSISLSTCWAASRRGSYLLCRRMPSIDRRGRTRRGVRTRRMRSVGSPRAISLRRSWMMQRPERDGLSSRLTSAPGGSSRLSRSVFPGGGSCFTTNPLPRIVTDRSSAAAAGGGASSACR